MRPRDSWFQPMADVVSAVKRSAMMAGIRGKNTNPEMLLRAGLHRRGLRYRLHDRSLPGSPDMIFVQHRAVLFANGCFWHGHFCHLFKWPTTRPTFWKQKIEATRHRDTEAHAALRQEGWRVAIVWECALKGLAKLPLAKILDKCETWVRSDALELEIIGIETRPSL